MNCDIFHVLVLVVVTRAALPPGFDLVRMCQFNSAARHRPYGSKFYSSQIDFTLCTHYVFAFANVDSAGKTIQPADPEDEGPVGQYMRFTVNKYIYRQIKVLLSVGGPSESNNNAFKVIVRAEGNMRTFAQNAIDFIRQRRFDGLEIDWQRNTNSQRLLSLLKALKNAFIQESLLTGRPPLMLTLKCPGLIPYAEQGFNSKIMAWYVDYLLLVTYDLVMPDTPYAAFSSPLYGMKGFQPDISVNSTVRYYERVGMPFKKMLLGIRAAGRYSRLTYKWQSLPGSSISREIVRGSLYNLTSTMTYPEICQMIPYGKVYFDDDQKVPYLVFDDYWVGYENQESIRYKIQWLGSLGFAGTWFPGLDEDDFAGTVCGEGKHPLLNVIKAESLWNTALLSTSAQPGYALTTFKSVSADTGNDYMEFYLLVMFITLAALTVLFISIVCVLKSTSRGGGY